MQKTPDWITLWRELADRSPLPRESGGKIWTAENDPWRKRAQEFESGNRGEFRESDPIQEFVTSQLQPEDTVVDIGAGTGRWARLLARRISKVTAVDPSPSMLEAMRQNIAKEEIKNIEVIEGFWPEVAVESYDVSLCSHAIYASADFPAFINRMVEVTRRTCYLVLRVPNFDGIMSPAFQYVHGLPHDSPNFVVAYNALLQMGIQANVLMGSGFRPWTNPTLEDAFNRLKQRLFLEGNTSHDEYLRNLLRDKLILRNGAYVWPDGMRSALVYWDVEK